MTSKKLYRETYNFLMTALIFLAVTTLFQKLLLKDLAPWVGVLYFTPCFLAYPLGRFLHGKRPLIAVPIGLFSSLAFSAIPILLSWQVGILTIICYALTPVFTFILFNMVYISGGTLVGSKRYIGGIIIFLINAFFKGAHYESYATFVNVAAFIFLVAGLITFNRENLRDATSHGSSSSTTRFPPGMRKNNIILVTVIIVLGLMIASIKSLSTLAADAVIFIIFLIVSLFNLIGKFMGIGGTGEPPTGSSEPMMGGEIKDQNPIIEMIVQIVIILIIVAAIAGLLYGLYKLIKNLIKHMPDWIARILGKYDSAHDETYIDITEDLLDKGGFRKEISKNWRSFLDRITYRQPHFDDLPDNNAKVRFVFKALLKRMKQKEVYTNTKTPIELTPAAQPLTGADTDDFIHAYNEARYSNAPIPDDDAKLAKKLLRKL